jgi:transcriptional regulator with XRE-family HTH domain
MIDLKALRIEAELTQDDIASQLEINRSYVSKIERGHRQPDLWMVVRWVAACGKALEVMDVEAADAIATTRALAPDDRELLMGLLKRWPSLADARQADLRVMISHWLTMSK